MHQKSYLAENGGRYKLRRKRKRYIRERGLIKLFDMMQGKRKGRAENLQRKRWELKALRCRTCGYKFSLSHHLNLEPNDGHGRRKVVLGGLLTFEGKLEVLGGERKKRERGSHRQKGGDPYGSVKSWSRFFP